MYSCHRWQQYTALHFGVAQGHVKVVESLLNALANPSLRDTKGRTPLDLAVMLRDAKPEMYVRVLRYYEGCRSCLMGLYYTHILVVVLQLISQYGP